CSVAGAAVSSATPTIAIKVAFRQPGNRLVRNLASQEVSFVYRTDVRRAQRCMSSATAVDGKPAMTETDKVFTGSIAENYDRYLVPLIFEKFAADIAQRAAALSPGTVLETAAGSGVVTRALAPKLA